MLRSTFLLPLLVATNVLAPAQAFDGEIARLPRPRPAIAPPAELAAWADAAEGHFRTAGAGADDEAPGEVGGASNAVAAIEALAPLPRPRPRPASTDMALALVGPQRLPSIPVPVEADDSECPARLETLGVAFTEEPAIDGACSVARPLKVTALGSGVAIEPAATLNCRTAESLARWVKEALVPKAQARFGAVPTGIVNGSTYVCRPRNGVAGAKLSEHAHANAIDIGAIRFEEREPVAIGVNEPESAEASFEGEIRAAACDSFTTVLGPGSDAAHETHLHFDMMKRRGGYRLCELGEPTAVRAPAKTSLE